MRRCQEKNAQDASRIGFNSVPVVVPQEGDHTLVLTGELNDAGRGASMESEPVPDNDLSFGHARFFGASRSLAR